MKTCLILIQSENVDLSTAESISAFIDAIVPEIREQIEAAKTSKRSRDCSVSAGATVSAGGAATGTVTVTCGW